MSLPTYNGWPNYPTWNVALWMDNDQGSYGVARELANTAIANNTDIDFETEDEPETLDADAARADLADALEAWHEEMAPELEGFTADIYGWAMGYVDWRHIAENLIHEMKEED